MSELSIIDINNVNYSFKDNAARNLYLTLNGVIEQEQTTRIATCVVGCNYNSQQKTIELLNANDEVVGTIDATLFIKDGMVSDVAVVNGYLVITFNTDSGKSPISIPLTSIFNPSNYYQKSEIDSKLTEKQSEISDLESKIGYYECGSEASSVSKTVTASNYVLGNGGSIKIKMQYANTANNATLNINSTGAKALYYDGARASSTNTWEAGEVLDVYYDGTNFQANNSAGGGKFATGEKVRETGIDAEPTAGSVKLVKSGGVYASNNTKMDKSYPIYETSQLTETDTQYQTGYYINFYGAISPSTTSFGVLGFDCVENQELFISGSFGGGAACLGVFQDDNGNVKGLVFEKPLHSPYDNSVVNDYYCKVPSGATKIYVQTYRAKLQNPSCKLVTNTTYRQYHEIILQNETDIDSIQTDLEHLQPAIYTEVTIPQTWVNRMVLSSPVVGEAPNFINKSDYDYCYIQNLKYGDVVNAYCRAGSTYKYGAKLKNGIIVAIFEMNDVITERTYIVDDTFDAIILNNYYASEPTAEVITKGSRIAVIESDITDLQETVNDIIEQGVGGEFNLLCFGNSFTQDTISYIPWLIKECEPNLKLNVYFTYMGGMPISQCLAYISNGTIIALNESGNPTTKYENHGGWDRIYSYSNGEWVEPDPSATNYHKSYTLYKYEDGANGWVSQSEPTAASVLQMRNWDLITIQQGGSINFGSWDYYFKPYVYKIQAELQKQVKHNFTLGYLMTHASYSTSSETLLSRYNEIVKNTTKMLENTPVEIVMPYATALQNARTTYLDRFGAGGHLLADTAHVNDGIGCLTCAYANVLAILKLIGSKKSIIGSQIVPDAAWLSEHNVPAVSTYVLGLSRYNIAVAQQCAVMAIKYPLQLTDMVAKGMVGQYEIEIVDDAVDSSNPVLSANAGDTWETIISPKDDSVITSVQILMGETDITSTAYDSITHEIIVSNIDAKLTITVTLA